MGIFEDANIPNPKLAVEYRFREARSKGSGGA
jgi:hypothetical protein